MSDIKPDKHISSLLVAAATCRIMFPDEGDIGRAVHILANETERLVEDVHRMREEREQIDEAISGAGFEPRDGETTLKRVKRLVATNEKDREAMNEWAQSSERERARAKTAEAELAALRMPVDVKEATWTLAQALAKQTTGWNGTPNINRRAHSLESVVKPVVERVAQLAREAEELRAELAAAHDLIRIARAALPERGSECYSIDDAPQAIPGQVLAWRVPWTGLRDAVIYEIAEPNGSVHRVEIGPRDEVNVTTWLLGPVESPHAWLKEGPFPRWSEVPEGWALGLALALVRHLSSMVVLRENDLTAARAELAKVAQERDATRLRLDLRISERDEALQQLTAARAENERLTRELTEARVALVSAERRATERAEGRPLSEPWNADAVYAVRALLHDDSQ